MEKREREENLTFRALCLLGIVFVVDGHTALGDLFDMGRLFGYYSFHLLLFAFVSGYFLRADADAHPLREIARKARRLLLPLYLWNAVYGVGAALLRRFAGFTAGAPLSAYTLLIAPLTDGQHFAFNLGAWFLFPLFLAESLLILARRASRLWRGNAWVTLLVCLAPGAACVQALYSGARDFLPLFLLRALILLPGCAMGKLYRDRLERLDTLPTAPWLLCIAALRALLCLRYGNLSYLLSDCSYFPCGALGVYLGGALAIAFMLRVARLIAPHMRKSRLALAVSRNTFDVMMHHYMGFFALNCAFLLVNWLGLGAADFSVGAMRADAGYVYAPGGSTALNLFYILAGLFVPLAIGRAARAATGALRAAIRKIRG